MSTLAARSKLPACERCRKAKTKCDAAVPKCTACVKADIACIIVDTSTGDRYGREQLDNMQQRLEMLEVTLRQHETALFDASPVSPLQQRTHYVGDGSGSDMFHRVSTSASTAEARAKVLEQLKQHSSRSNEQRNQYSSANEHRMTCNELPTADFARTLIDRYISHSHLLHPLLSKETVYSTFDRLYGQRSGAAEKQDLYLIFMISAISSVTMFRRGLMNEHPYGYYLSAARLMPYVPLIGSLQAIQNLLLIARFGTYYHIECSIWDLSRLCMRQCVELGLHLASAAPLAASDEQLRRNLFWDCYVHDRYSSGILGRPFAISEDDIEVALPFELAEDQLSAYGDQTLEKISRNPFSASKEAQIFTFVIKLRRVTARSQVRFFSPKALQALPSQAFVHAGEVLRELESFLEELSNCRLEAPTFVEAQSLYERPDWHDFMVEKDKLIVIRGAFASLSSCGSHIPHKLLKLCLTCATNVIDLYTKLFSTGVITWTRSYFQILFTSGLSTIYALSQLKFSSPRGESFGRASQALTTCSELLSQFVSEMADAARFAEVFKALSKPYIRSVRNSVLPHDINEHNTLHNSGENGTDPQIDMALNTSGIAPAPTNDPNMPDVTAFELDMRDLEDWPLFNNPTGNFLGQMEANIGEFAWGTQHDLDDWQQYFTCV